ncbi:RNA 2',3'-cyclic phosphodiesterase [Bacillus kwashiorkori]|uniref:RNA 2',3'-cyclic phosphodiesterase n=1 Tax=Bacillus kwashiorkori TaxID=1522318 RepID=UPI000782BE3F|nr:RNA 2',3'-cyclic phosphodiesterase [Bacillus kwashiorkori]
MDLHYFFAVKLPDEAKEVINEWIQKKKSHFPFKNWVHPQDYHITLAFLGSCKKDRLDKLNVSMEKMLWKEESFSLTLNELGFFGSEKQPRVFWLDVLPSESLLQIQKKVYNHCIDSGFILDKKPFRPHITLARKWQGETPFNKSNLVKIQQKSEKLYTFMIDSIVLYESHVKETPKYYEYFRYPLSDSYHK